MSPPTIALAHSYKINLRYASVFPMFGLLAYPQYIAIDCPRGHGLGMMVPRGDALDGIGYRGVTDNVGNKGDFTCKQTTSGLDSSRGSWLCRDARGSTDE